MSRPDAHAPDAGLPTLWHFRVSHFNEKVRWALDYKKIPHRRRALVPGFHIPRVRFMTGQDKTPVLEIGGRALHDSTAIIAELERLHPDPPLYPSRTDDLERALAIEDHYDEVVAPEQRRLFWSAYLGDAAACARVATDGFGPARRLLWRAAAPALRPVFRSVLGVTPDEVARAEERLSARFDRLEEEIGPSGYLVGDGFTVADLTAAAVLTAILRPPQFSYPLPEPWPRRLVELRASIADRRGAAWVMDIYARHRGSSAEVRAD